MALSANLMSKLKAAQVSRKSDYFTDGMGTVMLKEIRNFQSQQGLPTVVFDFEVVNSQPKDGGTPNAPGSDAATVHTLGGKYDYGFRDVKSTLFAIVGGTPDKFDEMFESLVAAAMSPEQPLRGALVNYSTFRKPNKSGGNNTYVRFSANGDNGDEALAKRRADLDARKPIQAQKAE